MGLGRGNYFISVRRRRARFQPLGLGSNRETKRAGNAAAQRERGRPRAARGPPARARRRRGHQQRAKGVPRWLRPKPEARANGSPDSSPSPRSRGSRARTRRAPGTQCRTPAFTRCGARVRSGARGAGGGTGPPTPSLQSPVGTRGKQPAAAAAPADPRAHRPAPVAMPAARPAAGSSAVPLARAEKTEAGRTRFQAPPNVVTLLLSPGRAAARGLSV